MMRVDFMIIGAQKCGTTGLVKQLAGHPEVAFCRVKEPEYFNRTANWRDELERYHALFDPAPGKLRGEGSTMYTFFPEWPQTAERLHEYNPELKLIYIMREPVARIESHYAHRLGHKRTSAAPEHEVLSRPFYVNRSRYGVQLRPYLELFEREQLLLLVFEEYIASPEKTLQQVAEFLEISPAGFSPAGAAAPANPSVGQARWGPLMRRLTRLQPLRTVLLPVVPARLRRGLLQRVGVTLTEKPLFSPELKRMLWRLLEDDVATVESLLGRRLEVWRAR